MKYICILGGVKHRNIELNSDLKLWIKSDYEHPKNTTLTCSNLELARRAKYFTRIDSRSNSYPIFVNLYNITLNLVIIHEYLSHKCCTFSLSEYLVASPSSIIVTAQFSYTITFKAQFIHEYIVIQMVDSVCWEKISRSSRHWTSSAALRSDHKQLGFL